MKLVLLVKNYAPRVVPFLFVSMAAVAQGVAGSAAGASSGAIDMSPVKTFVEQLIAWTLFLSAVFCLYIIVTALISLRDEEHRARGVVKLASGVIAGIVVGSAIGWVSSLTGQSIAPGIL